MPKSVIRVALETMTECNFINLVAAGDDGAYIGSNKLSYIKNERNSGLQHVVGNA